MILERKQRKILEEPKTILKKFEKRLERKGDKKNQSRQNRRTKENLERTKGRFCKSSKTTNKEKLWKN